MKITKIKEEKLIFDDNSFITYDTNIHNQFYNPANNYADFYSCDKMMFYCDLELPLLFGKTKGGFYFGNNTRTIYVLCFSEQNIKENEDYKDNTIKIIYNDGKGNETVVLENVECKIIDDNY